jgi:hypothetical protein
VPDDGLRHELVNGALIVNAAAGVRDQDALLGMGTLRTAVCPPHLKVLIAPFSVGLSADTDIQPDVVVARPDRLTERGLPGPPELVDEVKSCSTRLHVKRQRFEEAGRPSFGVVDPSARPEEAGLAAWQLDAVKRYEQVAGVTGEQEFQAMLPFPVTVSPAALVW